MRLILPGLVLLLLTACGLKDDLYLPDDASPEAPSAETVDTSPKDSERQDDDAPHA